MLEIIFIIYALLAAILYSFFWRYFERHLKAETKIEEDRFRSFFDQKKEIGVEKNKLNEEAMEVFTLYELTRTLAKNFSETEAFNIFKTKLAENVKYEDCRILPADDKDLEELAKSYTVIELKAHKELLGYLALNGCSEVDRDKAAILAHQFALAIRRDRLYQDLEQLAITDSLTAVHTRRHFLSRLEEEFRRAKNHHTQLSFLMVDVDYFKHLNDQYGHLIGDQVLRRVAELIKESVREIDIVGRYGGEEFAIALPETDVQGAQYVAERIRSSVAKSLISAYDAKVHVTVSIGLANFPQDAKDKNELIERADWALYRAKKGGRNLVCNCRE